MTSTPHPSNSTYSERPAHGQVEGDRRFRLLFERIPDPMLLLDVESGVFTDWNPAAMRMLNFPAREEVIALRPADISPAHQPDGRASDDKAREMMDIARREGSHRFEWTICSPYRSEVVIEVLLTTIAIDGREVFITTWRDLSQQKRTERDLVANKLRWKFALEGAGDGVWDWNIQDGTVFFSPRWKTMLGYEEQEIDNALSEWSERVHPDDLPRVMADVQAHLDGRTPGYRNEHRMLCRNGEYKWILDRGKVISDDADGRPLRMVGTHTDITERRRVQTELERAEATQRALLDAMADGVFVAQEHRFVFVNPALPRMLGYTVEEFTGLTFADVLHPDFLELWSERYERRIGSGPEPQRRYEVQLLNRDRDRPLWIELIASRFTYRDEPAVLGIVRDISDKKINEQTIWKQANYDALTGLPNRHLLLHHLRQEMRLSQRSGRQLAVLFIDLDRFKEVNDTLGHPAGDSLLQQAAQRITGCMRDTDAVARFGGDEFAVVLGGLEHPDVVEQIAGKILSALHQPFQLFNELVYVSASIGITLYPDSAQSQEDLLKQADQAMYDAKRAGRNRMSYFTPSMQASSERRLRLVSDMHTALTTGQFHLVYQPIVEIATGRVRKAEALMRWQHPERGHVSPTEFIPIAEETGLILPMGDWITRTAVGFARHLQQRLGDTVQISINHSPLQLRNRNGDYPGVVELLRKLDAPGSLVAVEITEGMLVEADEPALDCLYAMRDAGVQVSLDDFGTGYSSLSYLKKFDIDYLKIDQSFVRGLSRDSSELALCEAMIVMAHKLGMQVIAEGVETIHQLELLRAAHCDYAQGYLFSRPLPAEHFEAWLRENG
ncbi:sensor domain-containing protein [Methyloversatilis sp. MC4-4]|uniref:sensor domain-containing protein n=1 Tax=Methyloversatilis sp. MC4-4 TaxID=3132824 RepID=UPI003CF52501